MRIQCYQVRCLVSIDISINSEAFDLLIGLLIDRSND